MSAQEGNFKRGANDALFCLRDDEKKCRVDAAISIRYIRRGSNVVVSIIVMFSV